MHVIFGSEITFVRLCLSFKKLVWIKLKHLGGKSYLGHIKHILVFHTHLVFNAQEGIIFLRNLCYNHKQT